MRRPGADATSPSSARLSMPSPSSRAAVQAGLQDRVVSNGTSPLHRRSKLLREDENEQGPATGTISTQGPTASFSSVAVTGRSGWSVQDNSSDAGHLVAASRAGSLEWRPHCDPLFNAASHLQHLERLKGQCP